MTPFRVSLAAVLLCGVAHPAALVPISATSAPVFVPALEPNRGQANADVMFVWRGANVAVRAQSIEYSPLGALQEFVGGAANLSAVYSAQVPGTANFFGGSDSAKWVTGVPRYSMATVAGVYEGVDAVYRAADGGQLILTLRMAAGVDPARVVFEVKMSRTAEVSPDGRLIMRLGTNFRLDPALVYAAARARQNGVERTVSYAVKSVTQFGFQVDGWDRTMPLEVEIPISGGAFIGQPRTATFADANGNRYAAATIAQMPGKDDPFPQGQWAGCGVSIAAPIACTDVAVSKFNAAGELVWVSYLAGRTNESAALVKLAADGALVVAGGTDSSDFPTSAGAFQTAYAGPAAAFTSSTSSDIGGDFFVARMDAASGALRASTFLGGPNADEVGEVDLGADGSVYFLHKWLGRHSAGRPTTRGALMGTCTGDPCQNAYAAHLSANLGTLLYGTYLPGNSGATARLHSDGSVFFVGSAEAGFPVTPTAYQKTVMGGVDAFLARLDPTGSSLMFGTYFGTAKQDTILRMAVAGDGSIWALVSSLIQCCVNIDYSLVRIDSKGERVLANKPYDVGDLMADGQGNVYATGFFPFQPSANAFLSNSCGSGSYVKLSPAGDVLFGTYLPYYTQYDFGGRGENGLPMLAMGDGLYQVSESASAGVYTGCVVNAASYGSADTRSPGEIVTLFGSEMGPREGVAFQLENGKLPTALGGTSVFVNGVAIPLLYVSHSQINAVMPYDVPVNPRPEIQVVRGALPGNVLKNLTVQRAGIAIFRTDDSQLRTAAALNEDGTVNSASNPAKPGSIVVLFGTGGGTTVPPSVAGEVTPLELRPLEYPPIVTTADRKELTVEFAGAAPGLAAGVMQLNVKLPEVIPPAQGYPADRAVLNVETRGLSYYPGGPVTVYVQQK